MVFRIARMIDAMKEKQEYIIPDNVRSDFEVVQNVTVKDLVCFLPTLLVVVPILLIPISIYVKIPVSTICLIVSAVLVYLRPVRENIPFWQHARDLVRFSIRTKVYYYRKER